MNEKENGKNSTRETKLKPSLERSKGRQIKSENIDANTKLIEQQDVSRKSLGKRQRRQHKLDPNRG